jgi:hypothetical protein
MKIKEDFARGHKDQAGAGEEPKIKIYNNNKYLNEPNEE